MVMLLSVAAFAQTKVSGTVSDPSGEPVAGANVVLKGSTTVYTMTDNQGKFSISVPADGVLSVNCLGFVSTEVDVAGKTQIDVVLENDAETLDETIVVAYGTATKASFTGSAAMVKGDGKSASRKRKTRGVWKHWLITAGLFVIAALTQFAF